MPTGFETYTLYVALKNHFTRLTYDFHKYNGKVSAKYSTFERRRDRYFFEKIGSKYPKEKLTDLFVANFIENPDLWIGDMLEGQADETYLNWTKKIESMTYLFTEECDGILKWLEDRRMKFNDLFKVNGSDHPILVKMVLQKVISLESFIILDKILGFCERINKKLGDPIWENLYLRVLKYSPFLSIDTDRCKRILRNKIEEEYLSVI
jgi:hypothetical protein